MATLRSSEPPLSPLTLPAHLCCTLHRHRVPSVPPRSVSHRNHSFTPHITPMQNTKRHAQDSLIDAEQHHRTQHPSNLRRFTSLRSAPPTRRRMRKVEGGERAQGVRGLRAASLSGDLLGSLTHLPALPLQTSHALLSPLASHPNHTTADRQTREQRTGQRQLTEVRRGDHRGAIAAAATVQLGNEPSTGELNSAVSTGRIHSKRPRLYVRRAVRVGESER